MGKKFLIALATILVLSSATTAFASVNTKAVDNEPASFIDALDDAGCQIEQISNSSGIEEYNVSLDSGALQSHIIVNEKDNGDVEYNITEGNLENCIRIDSLGNIFLDDEPVMVTEDSNGQIETYQLSMDNYLNDRMITRSAHRNYCTEDCPYGKTKDYTAQHDTNKKVISLGSKIIEAVTVTAVAGLVVCALGITGFGAVISDLGFTGVYAAICAKNPRTSAFSLTDKITVHKDKGMYIAPGKAAYYHVLTYYANDDYTSPIKPIQKFFNVIEF